MIESIDASTLRVVFGNLLTVKSPPENQYVLALSVGSCYAGVSSTRQVALVVPLEGLPTVIARAAGGCLLRPAPDVEFSFAGRIWRQHAAILECTDSSMLDAFSVLTADVARRLLLTRRPQWKEIVDVVDEWQALLAKRRVLSREQEIGIWGELWFLWRSSDPARLSRAWIGPEGGSADFALAGRCVDIKTSRSRLTHFVSQAQVERPLGDMESYFVSLWVGTDPERGMRVPELVERLLKRMSDPTSFLKSLLQIGYSPADEHVYSTRFALLESPLWFDAEAIPRVRLADPGVSDLRYMVALDQNTALAKQDVEALTFHFLGAEMDNLNHADLAHETC